MSDQPTLVERLRAPDFWSAFKHGQGEFCDDIADAPFEAADTITELVEALKTASWLLADISPDGLVKKQIDEVIAKVQQP